jgi:hypothetical protein
MTDGNFRVPSNGTPYRRTPGEGRPIGYYCRKCHVGVESPTVPAGWYILTRASDTPRDDGRPGNRHHRLGVYCSAICLAHALRGILADEEALGGDWQHRVQIRPREGV